MSRPIEPSKSLSACCKMSLTVSIECSLRPQRRMTAWGLAQGGRDDGGSVFSRPRQPAGAFAGAALRAHAPARLPAAAFAQVAVQPPLLLGEEVVLHRAVDRLH